MTPEEIKQRHEDDQDLFAQVANTAHKLLASACQERHLPCSIEPRVKDLHSLLKKLLFKKRKEPLLYEAVIDRVGVRVILPFADQLAPLEEAIKATFEIDAQENTLERLKFGEFGYSGVHYEVRLKKALLEPERALLADLRFELQVHTKAQSLFASSSHTLLYKPDIQNLDVRRAFARISAVLELVDLEMIRVRELLAKDQDARVRKLLMTLEAAFLPFARQPYNREMSLEILGEVIWMMFSDDFDEWQADFDNFVKEHQKDLDTIFDKYKNDFRNPLLTQPEALLVFYAQEKDSFAVKDKWPSWIGQSVLSSFQGIWPK